MLLTSSETEQRPAPSGSALEIALQLGAFPLLRVPYSGDFHDFPMHVTKGFLRQVHLKCYNLSSNYKKKE